MRSLFFMGSTTAIRLAFGLLSFSIMARYLGPIDFGLVMSALAAATLAGLLANFGFANYALREIGMSPDKFAAVLSDLILAKGLLYIPTAVICGAIAYCTSPVFGEIFLVLCLAQAADAFTELLNVGFRATGRYGTETKITTAASLLQCAVVLLTLATWPTAIAAAAGYAGARWLVLLVTYLSQQSIFAELRYSSLRSAGAQIMAAKSYAFDYSLQSMFGPVDSVLLLLFTGPATVGIYQAGMRVFQGAAQSASVLGNVFIPKLSAAIATRTPTLAASRNMQSGFMALGFAGAVAMIAGGDLIVDALYGAAFERLGKLFPLFGLLFYVRFVAASWGIVLTASGRQKVRAGASLVQWIGLLSIAPLALPVGQTQGWLWLLIGSNAGLGLIYLVSLRDRPSGIKPEWVVACILLVPLLLIFQWKS